MMVLCAYSLGCLYNDFNNPWFSKAFLQTLPLNSYTLPPWTPLHWGKCLGIINHTTNKQSKWTWQYICQNVEGHCYQYSILSKFFRLPLASYQELGKHLKLYLFQKLRTQLLQQTKDLSCCSQSPVKSWGGKSMAKYGCVCKQLTLSQRISAPIR